MCPVATPNIDTHLHDYLVVIHPDMTHDAIGGVRAERLRWMALLDYAEANGDDLLAFTCFADMLAWLREMGEKGWRLG